MSAAHYFATVLMSLGLACGETGAQTASADGAQHIVRLGTFNAPPIVFEESYEGRTSGYFGDYLRAVEQSTRLRFEVSYFETPDLLVDAMRAGQVEVGAPLHPRSDLEPFALFTAPIGSFPVGIFRSSAHSFEHVAFWDLEGRNVVVIAGNRMEERVKSALPRAEVFAADDELAAFRALVAGEAEFAVIGVGRAAHAINAHGLYDIVLAGYAPFRMQPAFAVRASRPELFRVLNEAVGAMQAREIELMRRKWLTPLEQPWFRRPEVVPWLISANLMIAAALFALAVMRRKLLRRSRRLSRTQRLLDQTSRSALVGGWEYELATDKLIWTDQAYLIYGADRASFRPSIERCLDLCDESSRERIRAAFKACCADGVALDEIFRLQTADGRQIWAAISAEAERENGRIVRISGSLRNIDELRRQQLELERSEKLYRALAHGTSDMVSVHDREGVFLYVSPSAKALTGYAPEELVGRHADDFRPTDRRMSFQQLRAGINACKGSRGGKYRFVCKDGSVRWCEYRASIMEGSELEGEVLVVSRDITERLATEARFRYLALHDSLTGLANRVAFSERLNALVAAAGEDGSRLAVCFLDTDNFKAINDARGHLVGDEVIKELARRVKRAVGERHLVSRFGGDEFAVLIESPASESAAETAARQVIEAFAAPIELADGSVVVTASVGLALFPEDASSAEELLIAADMAMYAAKIDGKNTYRRYTSERGRASLARARALQDIRGALEREELELFYQPKIRLADERIAGVEALLRWRKAEGYRSPAELIAAAEESGFIRTLGRWVLETAARQIAQWTANGIECKVAVNVSVRQLHDPDFLGHLRELVAKDPCLHGRLELEITETAIATDVEAVPELLAQVRKLRIGLHIDDFGTGYSSLSYLGRLPVDTLKIDRSLVAETTAKRDAREIVRAIIALARALGLETIAEGVETPAHAAFLKSSGCTQAQGYLYARPMPADEATRWMERARVPEPQRVVAAQ